MNPPFPPLSQAPPPPPVPGTSVAHAPQDQGRAESMPHLRPSPGSATGRPPRVMVIGALPPPLIGPYLALERLLQSAEFQRSFELVFLDLSDPRGTDSIGRFDWGNLTLGIRHALKGWAQLLLRAPSVVYLGVSQGTWGYLRDLTFLLPAVLLRRKVVVHLRGSEFGDFYRGMPAWLRGLTRFVFRRVHSCIVLGQCLRRVMADLLPPERIVVIPNGIDCRPFDAIAPERPTGLPAKRILFLAHLMRRKGIFEALEAFALVRRRHPEARITFAGGWQNEPDRAAFERRLDELGLRDCVDFTGVVGGNAKLQTYAHHQVFLFPPVQPEGLPWVILEAMSSRLPVVTTDQGAIAEVVVEGETGFVVAPAPEELAERLGRLLENPELARAMGEAGRQRIEHRFSEHAYQQAIIQTLQQAALPATAYP